MLLQLTKTQVRRLKSEVLNDLANNRCSSENLRINCLEELTRRGQNGKRSARSGRRIRSENLLIAATRRRVASPAPS